MASTDNSDPRRSEHGSQSKHSVLVIADPKAEYLNALQRFSGTVNFIISDELELLQEASPAADVILYVTSPNLLRAILPRATQLRWVHSFYAGVESILFPEFVASPAVLTNARGVYKRPLAEFVMAGVLFFTKDLRRLVRNQDEGIWQQFDVEETRGKVMGIVGYGETGRACAELARAFGMNVLGLRRRPELSRSDPLLDKVFGPDCLVEMLGACDYIVLTAPATPKTRRMIGETEINSMKPRAILINVGRGSLVDEAALVRALEQEKIRGAALDVFEVEPLASGHPFYRLKTVLVSPHSTDHTPGWRDDALQCFMRNLERFMAGRPLENTVDKQAGY
jgi:phosphoglycerate dehydrogenase-like enzyme